MRQLSGEADDQATKEKGDDGGVQSVDFVTPCQVGTRSQEQIAWQPVEEQPLERSSGNGADRGSFRLRYPSAEINAVNEADPPPHREGIHATLTFRRDVLG